MNTFSASESSQKIWQVRRNTGNSAASFLFFALITNVKLNNTTLRVDTYGQKKEAEIFFYLSFLVMYAHAVTNTTVRQAPASPETTHLMLMSAGNTTISNGIM